MVEEKDNEVETDLDEQKQLEEAQRMYLSEIMKQLTESDRFNRFFKINFEVQTYLDKEKKTFEVRLIERPPELAAIHLREMLEEHNKDNTSSLAIPSAEEVEMLKKDFSKI